MVTTCETVMRVVADALGEVELVLVETRDPDGVAELEEDRDANAERV